MRYDLVIRGGMIIDGSGLARFAGDVGVVGGSIVDVGRLGPSEADRVIDASGFVVTPGFIDPHTHLDPQLCWDPTGSPSLQHGVTTVVTGNCSLSLAPCRAEDRDPVARMFYRIEDIPIDTFRAGVRWAWESFSQYTAVMDGATAINLAPFVGHSTLRYYAMGEAAFEREASPEELLVMCAALEASMAGGALGLSTSRLVFHVGDGGRPIPSRLASDAELAALCAAMALTGHGLLQTDSGETTRDTPRYLREVLAPLAAATGIGVLISGTVQEAGAPQLWRETHGMIAGYQKQGLRIFTQANPARIDGRFTLVGTLSFNDMPTWRRVIVLDHDAKLEAFADPRVRDAMQYEAVDGNEPVFFSRKWDTVQIIEVASQANQWMVGRTVQDVAHAAGKRIIDVILDLAVEEDLAVAFLAIGRANGDDEAVAAQMASGQAIIGSSDAGAHVTQLCGAGDTSLLLSRWVREMGAFTLEEAIHALTFKPASVLGLPGRGLVRPGFAADLVVLDPDAVGYEPTRMIDDLPGGGHRLWRDSSGIPYVVVNGEVVIEDGTVTQARPGRVVGPAVRTSLPRLPVSR